MDNAVLKKAEIFGGMDDLQVNRLTGIAQLRRLRPEECLFLLGDRAEQIYVVLSGKVELTFPLSFGGAMREVCVESKLAGSALGWSALVKPYRFTLSARVGDWCDVAAFSRQDLLQVFEANPRTGYLFTKNVSELIGRRLLHVQALWAREVQRAITTSLQVPHQPGAGGHGSDDKENRHGI